MANKNLSKAKAAKNDEFYTQYKDIESELSHYSAWFNGKKVLANCDDYRVSNFVKYFIDNYWELGLTGFTAVCYDNGTGAWKMDYDGNVQSIKPLQQNGDFRSPESIELLKQADVVVTNPPFSLFREYVAQLMEYDKKFLVIGNKNAVITKEIFPLIKNNKIWLGYTTPNEFKTPDGEITKKVTGLCRWFTNISTTKRSEKLILGKHYKPEDYPKYDNYDAINVDKIADIPLDYHDVIGVPVTFIDKYCPDQFEIIWKGGDIEWCEKECNFYTPPKENDAELYKKQDKTWRIQNPYFVNNNKIETVYSRIFIKAK